MNDNGCIYVVEIKGEQYVEYKAYERRVDDLRRQIKELEYKINTLRARCRKSAIDALDNENYEFLYIVTADELKNDDKVKELQCELDKTYNELMEVEKDAQEKIAELESELEVKDNLLKIKNGLCGSFECLPSEPVSVANMLINAKEEYEPTPLEKALCSEIKPLVDKYSINDLEQIAEHLLVYCKHHREDEE